MAGDRAYSADIGTIDVSVIVPTYGRLHELQRCLESLAPGKQTLCRRRYEVVIADDNPDDRIRTQVQPRYPWVRWHRGDGPHPAGPGANRNSAARIARGTWLAFIDDDCVADAHWLDSIIGNVRHANVDIIEGRVICSEKPDLALIHFVENLAGGKYWTCNLAVRTSSFRNVGGFDERFRCGEDTDLAMRLLRAGARANFANDVEVEHPYSRIGPLTYIHRLFRAERWNTCLLARHHYAADRLGWAGLPHISLHLVLDRCRGLWHLLSQPESCRCRQLIKELWLTVLYPAVFFSQLYWWIVFSKALDRPKPQTAPGPALKTDSY